MAYLPGSALPPAASDRVEFISQIRLISQAETLLHGALLRVESGDESIVPELSNIKVAIGRSVIAATQAAVAALGNLGLTPCCWPPDAGHSASDAVT